MSTRFLFHRRQIFVCLIFKWAVLNNEKDFFIVFEFLTEFWFWDYCCSKLNKMWVFNLLFFNALIEGVICIFKMRFLNARNTITSLRRIFVKIVCWNLFKCWSKKTFFFYTIIIFYNQKIFHQDTMFLMISLIVVTYDVWLIIMHYHTVLTFCIGILVSIE